MQKIKTSKINVKNKILISFAVLAAAVSLFISAKDGWYEVYGFFGLSGNQSFSSPDSEGVSVHFIDVGQGDCTLVLTPERSILIDSGERDYYSIVINYLKMQGVKELDYVIASHPHSDHIGAMGDIINEFGADFIIMPKVKDELIPTTSAFERLLDSIENNEVNVIWAASGTVLDLGNNSRLEILAPFNDDEYDYDNLNNYSVVARFIYGNSSFLFTGDIENAAENYLTDSGFDINADVLKVAHHGSRTSSSAKFLNMVGGEFAIIGVGSPNSYNHPNDEVLRRIEVRDYTVFRTDLNGNIVFDCVSGGLNVYVQREEPLYAYH
ncbi:MAG: MBL fold metallo-hydrolase [Oscillospiraceae bacterium]|nr:MBL fold metallo-hydrolase [Oscillospiraceae bacterium]